MATRTDRSVPSLCCPERATACSTTPAGRGADVYLTSDLRHHPASEALAWPDAPALIDISHWAAEWTWLPPLAKRLGAALEQRGAAVSIEVSGLVTDPWTLHLS